MSYNDGDFPYLSTMEELISMIFEFAEKARDAQDDVQMGVYLKLTSRAVRCALEIYGDHLNATVQEMQKES